MTLYPSMTLDPTVIPHIIGQHSFRPSPDLLSALRAPAFLPQTLFETHWLWWISAFIVAVAVLLFARARADRRLMPLGTALLALSVLWVLAAYFLDTPAERLHKVHLALAQAASTGDVDTIVSYLAPDVTISAEDVKMEAADKQTITDALKKYGVKESTIISYTSTMESDNTARTKIQVITKMDLGNIPTGWKLEWTDIPAKDWQITRAQYVPATLGPAAPPASPTR